MIARPPPLSRRPASPRRARLVAAAALLGGCRVVDAPEALDDLVVFAFTTFDAEDGSKEAAADGMLPLLDRHAAELAEGYRVGELTQADLKAAGVDERIEVGITGVAATVPYASSVDGFAAAWTYPDMREINVDTVAFAVLREEGDRGCFLAHACDRYAYDGSRELDMGFFGHAFQDFTRQYRWVTLEDGAVALFTRELVPEGSEMDPPVVVVHQQFGFSAIYPDGAGARRLDTVWIDAEAIGLDVPDAFALDLAVSSMKDTAADVDAWVAENL